MIAPDGTAFDLHGPSVGNAVVLVHGLGINRQMWIPLISDLCEQYSVVTYDLYGHGESALPPEKPGLSVYANQLQSLLDYLSISSAAIVGFSLGGMINRRLAMDHPERIKSLVILNSPHERGEEQQRIVEERASDSENGPAATLNAAIDRWFTEEFIRSNPDYIAQIRHWILANDSKVFAECRQVLAYGVRELIGPEPPITHPALVMTCEKDSGSTPVMSLAIASEIEGAEAIIVPRLRHMGLVEQPELFTKPILRFLSSAGV